MTTNPKTELSNSFNELRIFHGKLLEDLDNVIIDHELIRDNWSIFFAVDYHLVHVFAYRSSNILSKYKKKIPLKDERSKIVKQQAALAYLFYGFKNYESPILLPPHIIELRNTIMFEHLKKLKRELRYRTIKDWGLKLFTDDEKKAITEMDKWYKESRVDVKLPDDLYDKLVNIAFDKFHDILFLTSGLSTQGLKIIQELIKGEKPRLQLSSELCRNYDELIKKTIKDPNSKWYELFSKIRKDKVEANNRDAKLIDIVSTLNDEFIRKKEKKFIYLLSDAEGMDIVLNPHKYPEKANILRDFPDAIKTHPLIGKENRMHRSSNIFLLYMMAAEVSIDETLKNLKGIRNRLLTFKATRLMVDDFIKKCKGKCNLCNHDQRISCDEIKELIKNQKEEYDEIISLSIISNRFPYLVPYITLDESGFKIEESIRAIALFLNGKCEKLERMVRDKEIEVEQRLNETMRTLRENIIELADKSIEDFIYQLKPFRRIPFKIIFRNDKIVKKIQEITEYISRDKIDIEKLRKYSSEVIQLTDDESIGEERHLLLSILLFNNVLLKRAKSIISDCILNQKLIHKEEYILIRALIMHQFAIDKNDKASYLEALGDCKKAIEKYPDDLRFHYMYGVIIGRGIQTHLEDRFTVDSVIEKFNKVYKMLEKKREDNLFKAETLNSIAYSITLKQDLKIEELNIAVDVIKKVGDLISEQDWDANFIDTKGVILYHKAKFAMDYNQRKKYLEESKELLEHAKRLSIKHNFLKYERKTIKNNLKNTNKLLKEIKKRTTNHRRLGGGGFSSARLM